MVLGSTIKQLNKTNQQSMADLGSSDLEEIFPEASSFIPQNPPEPLVNGKILIFFEINW